MRARARRALGVVKAFALGAPGPDRAHRGRGSDRDGGQRRPRGRPARRCSLEVGEVARAGSTGALFLVDEMHNLDAPEALGAVGYGLPPPQSARACPVVLVGAGLPPLPRLLFQAKPYAERLFTYRELGRLSDGGRARRAGRPGGAARRRVRAGRGGQARDRGSGGYPYFLQEYGRVLWREAEGSPITARRRPRRAQPIVEEALDRDFFRNRFESASDAEQRYLAAIADLGDGPQRTAEVSERAGYRARVPLEPAPREPAEEGADRQPAPGRPSTSRFRGSPTTCAASTRWGASASLSRPHERRRGVAGRVRGGEADAQPSAAAPQRPARRAAEPDADRRPHVRRCRWPTRARACAPRAGRRSVTVQFSEQMNLTGMPAPECPSPHPPGHRGRHGRSENVRGSPKSSAMTVPKRAVTVLAVSIVTVHSNVMPGARPSTSRRTATPVPLRA